MSVQVTQKQETTKDSGKRSPGKKQSSAENVLFQFKDNRSESAVIQNIQAKGDHNSNSRQLKSIQSMTNYASNPLSIQLKTMRGCLIESKQPAVAEKIHSLIHKSPGTKEIANDIAVYVDKDEDASSTDADVIEKASKKMGYSPTYANKLANNEPFDKDSLNDNSNHKVNGGRVESFTLSHKLIDNGESMRHQLHFDNSYDPYKPWQMHYNARNPALSSFRASDVTDAQAKLALKDELEEGTSVADNFTSIRRENIVSKSGKKWFTDNNPAMDQDLTPQHLASFLLTENGQSSAKIAAQYKKEIVSGKIETYGEGGFSVLLRVEDKEEVDDEGEGDE